MANLSDIMTFSIMTVLTVVIYGYFLPLMNATVLGSAVVAIAGIIPLVVMGKAAIAILSG